jgi:hypothetical protein
VEYGYKCCVCGGICSGLGWCEKCDDAVCFLCARTKELARGNITLCSTCKEKDAKEREKGVRLP